MSRTHNHVVIASPAVRALPENIVRSARRVIVAHVAVVCRIHPAKTGHASSADLLACIGNSVSDRVQNSLHGGRIDSGKVRVAHRMAARVEVRGDAIWRF